MQDTGRDSRLASILYIVLASCEFFGVTTVTRKKKLKEAPLMCNVHTRTRTHARIDKSTEGSCNDRRQETGGAGGAGGAQLEGQYSACCCPPNKARDAHPPASPTPIQL
jgi:hypothetical protein